MIFFLFMLTIIKHLCKEMPVATDTAQESTNFLTSSNCDANSFNETNASHLPKCSVKSLVKNKKSPYYDSFDNECGPAMIIPPSTHSPPTFTVQLPSVKSSHFTGAAHQPQTSHLSSQCDSRECSRRKLAASAEDDMVDEMCLSPIPSFIDRKSDSPTRKRQRILLCNQSNQMERTDVNKTRHPISDLKKRVVPVVTNTSTSSIEVEQYPVEGSNHAPSSQDTGLTSDKMCPGKHFFGSDDSFASFNVKCSTKEKDDSCDSCCSSNITPPTTSRLDSPILFNSASQLDFLDVQQQSEDYIHGNDMNEDVDLYEEQLDENFEDLESVVSSEQDDVANDEHSYHQTQSYECHGNEPPNQIQESPNNGNNRFQQPIFRHSGHNNGGGRRRRGRHFSSMPTQLNYPQMRPEETSQQHPQMMVDRMQYAVPVTMSSLAYPTYNNTRQHAMSCPLPPPRVVAFPTQSAPVLTTGTHPQVTLQQHQQQLHSPIPPYYFQTSGLSHPPTVRQNSLVTESRPDLNYPHHHHSAVPPLGGGLRTNNMYSIPTLNTPHQPSNLIQSGQPIVYTPYQNNVHTIRGSANVQIPSARQFSRTVAQSQFNRSNPVASYGIARRGGGFLPNRRQLPMQYHPSIRTLPSDGNRSEMLESSHPRTSVTSTVSPRGVQIPTAYMSALPPMFHDYAAVDQLATQQNPHRVTAASSGVHPSALHQPFVIPPWNVSAFSPPMPHYVAFHVPTLPNFMFNPLLQIRPYVSVDGYDSSSYEALLNLAERIGDVKPQGLSKFKIDQLPTHRYKAGSNTSDQSMCVICLCEWEPKQLLRKLPCDHQFHGKCIDRWLRRNRTCPICRSDAELKTPLPAN